MLESSVSQKYSNCNHLNWKEVRLPRGCEYYSLVECIDCGSFIRWGCNPKILKDRAERILMIDNILNTKKNSDYEKRLLMHIKSGRMLLTHESKKYQQILAEYKMNQKADF